MFFPLSLGSSNKSNNEIDGSHLPLCYHHGTAGAKPRCRTGVDRKRGELFERMLRGPPCECFFGPAVRVFVITSPSSVHFNFYVAPFVSFPPVVRENRQSGRLPDYLFNESNK